MCAGAHQRVYLQFFYKIDTPSVRGGTYNRGVRGGVYAPPHQIYKKIEGGYMGACAGLQGSGIWGYLCPHCQFSKKIEGGGSPEMRCSSTAME